jgi:signal transduction histidine kinase
VNPRSIRFRLTLWYAVVLSAALGVFGGLIWLSLRQRMMSELNEDLLGRAARFEKYFRSESSIANGAHLRNELDEFCQALPAGSSVVLRGSDGFTFRYMAPQEHPSEARTLVEPFEVNGQNYTLEVGAPAGEMLHTLQLLRNLLWGLLPVVIVIASLGGAWLSRRALKPVQDISNAARNIGIENLSLRLPVPETGDELAHLTEVLNTMFQRLESAVKTLSQFAADASHELRTPLAVIQTTADLALRRARTAESYRQSLEEVTEEARRMTKIVEDLLTLARGDAAVLDLPLAPLDLRDLLRDLIAETHNLAEAREIRVQTFFGEEPAVISGNRPALRRLFLALVDNALKYSHPGSEVALTIDRSDSRISVAVRDFGPGIHRRICRTFSSASIAPIARGRATASVSHWRRASPERTERRLKWRARRMAESCSAWCSHPGTRAPAPLSEPFNPTPGEIPLV